MGRKIHLLDKQLQLEQPTGGFQTSIDAVLLAAACPVKAGQSVLDLGCGVGAAGLCVAKRVPDIVLTGVELLEREASLARDNAKTNGFAANIMCTDIRDYEGERVDHVICNPPYLEDGAHLKSPDSAKASAMGHDETMLEDWIAAAHRNVKSKGSFTMIHRADMLDKILIALGKKFGATEIIPLWPKEGREAKRIIIRTYKDRKSPLKLHAGLLLHKENGDYTAPAEEILRQIRPLY
jgi:tRNA1(Val) A37 N6-methylase TrmN6